MTPDPDMTGGPTLAVTGSTGWLGSLVAGDLAARGVPQRLLVRDPARAPGLEGAVVRECAYGDPGAEAALAGVETLFMVSASESADRLDQHRAFVDVAAAAGVGHVVYVSFYGAAPDATFTLAREHHVTEEHIKASGMAWTFLRDNFYLEFLAKMMGEDGVIRGPGGEGSVAAVTHADIARCAVAVLLDPTDHAGRTYDLTGPEALTLAQVAALVTEIMGEPVTYHDETVPEAYESRKVYGAPDWQVEAWVSTYSAIKAGELAGVSGDVEALTGRRPTSLREYLVSRRDRKR